HTKPCSTFDGDTCTPILFGGFSGDSPIVFGVKLDTDTNPPTVCPLGTCTTVMAPTQILPPNQNFVSGSHPTGGGPWGSVNDRVYSFSLDPATGDLFKAEVDDANAFTSFDRVDDLVFGVTRQSALIDDGTSVVCTPIPCLHSIMTVFKKQCFTSLT